MLTTSRMLVLSSAILLAACNQQTPQSPAAETAKDDPTVQALVKDLKRFRKKVFDPNHPKLKTVIANLGDKAKGKSTDKVLYIVDGILYSNDQQLLEESEQYIQVGDQDFVTPSGKHVFMPNVTPVPDRLLDGSLSAQYYVRCRSDNSGPFSRVIAYPGYSWFNGYVDLPAQQYINQKPDESMHMYAGGWSTLGATPTAIDAGLQRNYDGRYQAILRMNYGGNDSYAYATPHHFLSGVDAQIEFFTNVDGKIWLSVRGYWEEQGRIERVWLGFASAPGFTPQGDGVYQKFTTSIAMPAGSERARLNNGSYAQSWWLNLFLGDYNSYNNTWSQHQWMENSGDTEHVCSNPGRDYEDYRYDEPTWQKVTSKWHTPQVYRIVLSMY